MANGYDENKRRAAEGRSFQRRSGFPKINSGNASASGSIDNPNAPETAQTRNAKARASNNRLNKPTAMKTGPSEAMGARKARSGRMNIIKANEATGEYSKNRPSPRTPKPKGRAARATAPGMLNTDMKNYAAQNKAAARAKMVQNAKAGALKGLRGNLIGIPLGAAIGVAVGQGRRTPTTKGQMGRVNKLPPKPTTAPMVSPQVQARQQALINANPGKASLAEQNLNKRKM